MINPIIIPSIYLTGASILSASGAAKQVQKNELAITTESVVPIWTYTKTTSYEYQQKGTLFDMTV